MRKDVAEKIRDTGRQLAEPPREPVPCDFASLVDGFLVHVLDICNKYKMYNLSIFSM